MAILNKIFNNHIIVLGSKSPRRQLLLSGMGIKFRVAPVSGITENYSPDMNVYDVANFLSKKKSQYYSTALADNEILLTADTIVICDGKILGKPADSKESTFMLKQLSGKTHEVITSITLRDINNSITFSETTKVTFRPLFQEEIEYYITNYKPFDKAGSYGVQEWIGYIGIEKIEGCYYNVMGLPLNRLYVNLKKFINL